MKRLVLSLVLLPGLAAAETLRVGPGERFGRPSAAALVAQAGDTVLVAPGRYIDCAIWQAPGITIRADGGEAEITGPVCAGKALFVVAAPDVVLEGFAFRGAAAESGNGAGIRAEGPGLTVRRSRFLGNQSGILTLYALPGARLTIEDSAFVENGARIPRGPCTGHALYVGRWSLLQIRRTSFEGTTECHHVKSRAGRTEISETRFRDGDTSGASYLIDLPNGGDLLLVESDLAKGPRTGNPRAAIMIGAEGVTWPTTRLELRHNRFANRQWLPTIFIENRSATPAELTGNRLRGLVLPLLGPGHVR